MGPSFATNNQRCIAPMRSSLNPSGIFWQLLFRFPQLSAPRWAVARKGWGQAGYVTLGLAETTGLAEGRPHEQNHSQSRALAPKSECSNWPSKVCREGFTMDLPPVLLSNHALN